MHLIKSMDLVEKTKLLRRLSVCALSKTHLDRYGSFLKIWLILSWDLNLDSGPVHGIQKENLLHVLSFHRCRFFKDRFCYNLNSLSKNVSRKDWDLFKKRGMYFVHINIKSFFPNVDQVRYIANITNTSIIGIESKLDKTILSH